MKQTLLSAALELLAQPISGALALKHLGKSIKKKVQKSLRETECLALSSHSKKAAGLTLMLKGSRALRVWSLSVSAWVLFRYSSGTPA